MTNFLHDEMIDSAALVATLNQYGVRYLRTATATSTGSVQAVTPLSLTPETLITAIVQHSEPRIREALILLFLRQPTFAQYVLELVETLPETAATTLQHFYTAAVYLQRLWRGKIEIYLGPLPLLPDYFGQPLWSLPSPTEHYGEAGLRVLARQFQAKTGDNWLSTYQSAMSLFFNPITTRSAWLI